MKKYKNMWFFQADTGGGDGGEASGDASPGMSENAASAFEPVPKITTGEKLLPGEKPVPAQSEPEPSAAPAGFDASKFAKEFGATLSETLRPVIEKASPQEPQMTPEEARKILNIWEPDENWYKNYDNLETRADAIAQMRDGLIKQADTLNQFRMREELEKLRAEIMPGLQTVSQTANQQREERFRTSYPQLGEPAIQPLIRAIAQDMVDKGQTFSNESELFKALASGVEAVMKISNPAFKLTAAENGSGQQTIGRGGRSLPVTSPGGGGGTGRREGGPKVEKPKGLAIFEK